MHFFLHFSLAFFDFFRLFHSWGVQTASVKISVTWDENLWRNHILKLTTFGNFFQLPHSALIDIDLENLDSRIFEESITRNSRRDEGYVFFPALLATDLSWLIREITHYQIDLKTVFFSSPFF